MYTLGILPHLGPGEVAILAMLALLIFGRRLPEVGRSLGKGIVEFRKGIRGIEDEIEAESSQPSSSAARPPLTAAGEDARVSHAASVETPAADPVERGEADAGTAPSS